MSRAERRGQEEAPPPSEEAVGPALAEPERRPSLVGRLYRRWFLDAWLEIDREGAEERRAFVSALPASGSRGAESAAARFDARPLWVLILVALVLVFQEYWGDRPTFVTLFPDFDGTRWGALGEFSWWTGCKIAGYFVLPAIALRVAGIRLRDCGLRVEGMAKHVWIYVVLYLAILPVIVAASYTQPFQHTYPFYKLAARSWTDLLVWEALYASSFFALEFLFRGFMLFTLRRVFGAGAIFVMSVPYCMIHFHKPVAEVVGAIFAGIILGTLALRTRSIWCGVLIHVSVALTMDMLSLWHTTGFPGSGRFVG